MIKKHLSFKPIILALYILFYIIFICVLNPLRIEIQIGFFLFSVILYIFRFNIKKLFSDLKLFSIFICFMIIIYMAFCFFGFSPDINSYDKFPNLIFTVNSIYTYWLHQGICRILLFLSSVFTFNIALSFIDIDQIISLPININYLKVIILAKSLFENAMGSVEGFSFYLGLIPEFSDYLLEDQNLNKIQKIKKNLKKNLLVILSLVFYIIRESEKQGELIDNRIKHCFKQNKKEDINEK